MPTCRLSLILSLLLLPSLAACGSRTPDAPRPPSAQSLDAIGEAPGAPREALAHAIDALFDSAAVGDTHALLVLRSGKVVAERYGPGITRATRLAGGAMAECVTGVMIGQLVSDGRLRLNETAPVPSWQRPGDPRGEITLKQLLQMRSGLRYHEKAGLVHESDRVRMLFLDGRDDMAGYAEAQPLEAMAGRKFEYSAATGVILADLATRAITDSRDPEIRRKAALDYLRTRFLDPAGMKSVVPEFDASGTLIGSGMMHATARDWARLGEFLRHGGSVGGAQLVPRGWIGFMKHPSPRNPGYGAMLWLNRPQSDGRQVLFPGQAPDSLVACIGELGKYLLVSPAQRLTVVRLGHSDPGQQAALRADLAALLGLFPRG